MARIPVETWTFYTITGPTRTGFLPPGLNTSFPQSELTTIETPDSYGLSITNDGRISKSVTAPTGTSRTLRQIVIDDITYYWIFERLWNFDGLKVSESSSSDSESSSSSSEDVYDSKCSELVYGAKYYDDIYVSNNLSKVTLISPAALILEDGLSGLSGTLKSFL